MASRGGTGLSSMVSGKSAHRQFMVRQSKVDYVKRVCSAKSSIDNSLPTTFRRRLQRDGRLPKEPPSQTRPLSATSQSSLQQKLTTTQFLPQPEELDLGGDLLETHKDRFTPARPFTPRINARKGGVVTQSRLVSSGIFVRPSPAPKKAGPGAQQPPGQQKNRQGSSNRRRLDGTFDVYDGGVAGRAGVGTDSQFQQQQPPQPPQHQSRTADWVLGGGNSGNGEADSGYSTLFSKLDESYYPFAEGIIKEIATSGVTSNRMIRIIMQKHIEQNRSRLKARQMEQACQLIGEYLGLDDEDEQDDDAADSRLDEPEPRPQLLPVRPQPLPPPSAPSRSHPSPQRQPFRPSQQPPPPQEDDPPTLTEVTEVTPTPTPAFEKPADKNDGDYGYGYDGDFNDADGDGSRSATPLDDFQNALRTQLIEEVPKKTDDYGEGTEDGDSVSNFGATLHPGQFEAIQTMVGSPSRGKTVRFSS